MKIQDQLRLMAEDWHSRIGYNSACEVLSKAADKIDALEVEQPLTEPELRAGIELQLNEIERLRHGLENCRLFAARNRKESWALLILGFCAEAGVVGSVTRDFSNADHHGPDWIERDGEYLK